MRKWRPTLFTTNVLSGREYRLSDDRARQWFVHYGTDGSGYGFLSWRCKRQVGFDWPDLGHGFPVVLRKGPFKVLFSGQIVKIVERTGPGGGEVEVWASGWIHTATADTYNWVYCDNRYNVWEAAEDRSGSFKPDLFDVDQNSQLWLEPRRGVDFLVDDYTRVRYTFGFGEVATLIVADYDVQLPSSWPGKLEIRDSNGVVLWSRTTTGVGSVSLTTTGSPTYFEVRFYVTAAGENTAADDTVYGKLTNVKVYSLNASTATLDAALVAQDVVSARLSDVGHGLSDSVDLIEEPGQVLEPAFFDRDMTLGDVLSWCVRFGDSDQNPWVWGVSFDDDRRIFLEAMDLTTVKYVVLPTSATLERGGDWGESWQKLYFVYTDLDGDVARTGDYTDPDVIARLGSYYRRAAVNMSITNELGEMQQAAALWLDQHAEPIASGSFRVRQGVLTPAGVFVPFDEIVPGGLVQVREWRALEASLTPTDYRDQTTTFPLAGVRIDEDAGTAELIPNTTSDAFARYMAVIQELISREPSYT